MKSNKNTPSDVKILGGIPQMSVRGFFLEKSDELRLSGSQYCE